MPYDRIHNQTMTPTAHLLWSSVWAGIASAAVQKGRTLRAQGHARCGRADPAGAARLGEAKSKLRQLRSILSVSLDRPERGHEDQRAWGTLDYQTSSGDDQGRCVRTRRRDRAGLLRTCGLAGYRNDGDVSIGRHLRDILSSPIMINNDRITSSMASAMMMSGVPQTVRA